MRRLLLLSVVLVGCGLPCLADDTPPIPETLVRLNVPPMAAPKPALRYLLLPELREMNPGNPVQNYLKCFAEQQNFFFNKESCDRREKLLVMPLKELAAQDVLDYGRSALRQADWAARLDKPDWQILLQCKTGGLGLLLPDVQIMRGLATALKVRFRAEIAAQHFDDALRTAKTMFALARHMGEHPTLIGDLVGIAISNVAIGPLEEMLEQPGCPNLYWALTNLPTPLIPIDLGMQGERFLLRGEFVELDENAPMTEDRLRMLITHIDKVREPKKKEDSARAWLDARINNAGLVAAARQRLVDYGLPEERVGRFPVDQVFILDEWREFEVRRDDQMKLVNLPYWQGEALGIANPIKKTKEMGQLFAEFLLPALHKVRRAQARLDQRIALLRHVEALRLYAADHGGNLPASLAEVPVPLPDDPITGKPFHYKLEGSTAHLRGSPPPGEEKNASFNVHYAISIQK